MKTKKAEIRKTLSVVKAGKGFWVMSNWTGEIVRPWDLNGIVGLVRDFAL